MSLTSIADAPLRPVRLGSRATVVEHKNDCVYLRLKEPLQDYNHRATSRLLHWATTAPDRIYIARQCADGNWEEVTYSEAWARVSALSQWLLNNGLNADKPLMLLSENEIGHALLGLAALHVGIPFVPVSPAYSQLKDQSRLHYVIDKISPGAVYACDADRYQRALDAFPADTLKISGADLTGLYNTPVSDAVTAAHAAITPDTLGKVMFTSGSTGDPKGVLFPHRMLASNYQQIAQAMAFLQDEPPVMIDWLPWHHTFGGTHNLGIALYNGGSFYIDPGRPTPEGIKPTIELMRRVAPTLYFNTPMGYEAILPYLREDKALRETFFSRLQLLYYGAARMPLHLWEEIDRLSVETLGKRVLMTAGIGSTEAGPSPNFTPWDPCRQPMAGAPVAGVTIKVAPVNDKLEMRFKGPCITPGYWQDPERTTQAFDDEGYFCSGDAVVYVDPEHPDMGLRFDGRIADNFKLSSGTWVDVAALRGELIAAAAPYLKDAVITGHDETFLGAMLFPDYDEARALDTALAADATPDAVVNSPVVREYFQSLLSNLAASATGSSRRILRASLESVPPRLDNGELSDKNAISQRIVLQRRADTVATLHAETPASFLLAVREQ